MAVHVVLVQWWMTNVITHDRHAGKRRKIPGGVEYDSKALEGLHETCMDTCGILLRLHAASVRCPLYRMASYVRSCCRLLICSSSIMYSSTPSRKRILAALALCKMLRSLSVVQLARTLCGEGSSIYTGALTAVD